MNPSEPPMRDTTDSAISGIATKISPPSITPFRLYTPVTTAPVSRENERLSGKALGETPLISITSNPPANPATPALRENATTFNLPTLIPERDAATGLSRSALKMRPYLEAKILEISQIINRAASAQIQKNHLYCENSSPNLAGGSPISNATPCSPPKIAN